MSVRNLTYKIPNSLFSLNRKRIVERLKNDHKISKGSIFIQGGMEKSVYNTDTESLFNQESFFFHLFGISIPDIFGLIDIETGKSTLFIPKLPPSYNIWLGKIERPSFYTKKYEFDECYYHSDIPKVVGKKKLLLLCGTNSDSGLKYNAISTDVLKKHGLDKNDVDKSILYEELEDIRSHKTEEELNVYRYVCKIAAEGQKEMMSKVSPGMKEYQLEAIFNFYCYYHGGCRFNSFIGICSSASNSAILHYINNQNELKDGSLVLCDMGVKYNNFCSDITRTFPVNGIFTEKQKEIYEIVLKAQLQVINTIKPDVEWKDMQKLVHKMILTGLTKLKILTGNVEKMIENELAYVFMPHGLGHFLGLDTHDVGGYIKGAKRESKKTLKCLRNGRKLEKGFLITVEPGLYFNKVLIDDAKKNEKLKGFLTKKLDEYLEFGGIRIEDDVYITHDGCENLTHYAPKSILEIEKFMKTQK